jgi:hypothetical protein
MVIFSNLIQMENKDDAEAREADLQCNTILLNFLNKNNKNSNNSRKILTFSSWIQWTNSRVFYWTSQIIMEVAVKMPLIWKLWKTDSNHSNIPKYWIKTISLILTQTCLEKLQHQKEYKMNMISLIRLSMKILTNKKIKLLCQKHSLT